MPTDFVRRGAAIVNPAMVDQRNRAPECFAQFISSADVGGHVFGFAFAARKRPIGRIYHDQGTSLFAQLSYAMLAAPREFSRLLLEG
jgi:hypothetical protein